ncbi:MAG: protein-disulfide reductase DsbD family protein [Planctomycetota bacterium]|nr:protein-disulfide reductase DsbD family protein [Planctomycetota bacterium]
MRNAAAILSGVLVWATTCAGQFLPTAGQARLHGSLTASHTAVAPGETFHLAVTLDIADGWSLYSPNPFDKIVRVKIQPAELTVDAPGLVAGDALWPADRRHESDLGSATQINYVYQKRAVVYVPIRVPAGAAMGEKTIVVEVTGQACSATQCDLAATGPMRATVVVSPAAAANPAWAGEMAAGLAAAVPAGRLPALRAPAQRPDAADLGTWAGLALAVLAGLILNVMPCVLPVIPLRVLSLVQMAGQGRRRLVMTGLAFAGGIVLFFAGIAAINVAVHLAWQESFSISGLFEFPAARLAMAMVVVALAANWFGLFTVTVPGRLAALGSRSTRRGGPAASVGMGLMMALLATPCSFAVLAQAFAWAQVVSLPLGTAAIVLVGVGMAAPHAALVAFPGLLKKLPRPGEWMERFRQSMGFLLLPVAVWLIFAGSEAAGPLWAIDYAIVLTACLWIAGRWVRYDAPLACKVLVRGGAAVVAVAAGVWMLSPAAPPAVAFEPFDAVRIDQAVRDGRTVLVKFTADTCTSCRWIDWTVYDRPDVAGHLKARQVVAFKADTTNRSSPAWRMLKEKYASAVPLTVVLGAGGTEVRLEGEFSKERLFEAIDQKK